MRRQRVAALCCAALCCAALWVQAALRASEALVQTEAGGESAGTAFIGKSGGATFASTFTAGGGTSSGTLQAAAAAKPPDPVDEGGKDRGVVVVLIMRTTVSPERHPARLEAIAETWGAAAGALRWHPDWEVHTRVVELGAAAAAAARAVGLGTYDVRDLGEDAEAAADKTALLLSALRHAAHEFGERLRFVAKGDDITFWLPGALCRYLSARGAAPIAAPLHFAGSKLAMHAGARGVFLSGGAGMLLSAETASTLVRGWEAGCTWLRDEFHRRSEDVAVAACLDKLGVGVEPALAAGGAELFNAYDPVRSLSGDFDKWFFDYKANAGFGRESLRCCSADIVTFHYVEADLARFLWRGLTGPEADLDALSRKRAWPAHMGGYARRPERAEEGRAFVELLQAIRLANTEPHRAVESNG
jgi:hypothetical protein